jgi:hypothetical protein
MEVVKIIDGTEGCHAGFIPRYIIKGSRRNEMKDVFGHAILLYKDTLVEVLMRNTYCLHGMASFCLLCDTQLTE